MTQDPREFLLQILSMAEGAAKNMEVVLPDSLHPDDITATTDDRVDNQMQRDMLLYMVEQEYVSSYRTEEVISKGPGQPHRKTIRSGATNEALKTLCEGGSVLVHITPKGRIRLSELQETFGTGYLREALQKDSETVYKQKDRPRDPDDDGWQVPRENPYSRKYRQPFEYDDGSVGLKVHEHGNNEASKTGQLTVHVYGSTLDGSNTVDHFSYFDLPDNDGGNFHTLCQDLFKSIKMCQDLFGVAANFSKEMEHTDLKTLDKSTRITWAGKDAAIRDRIDKKIDSIEKMGPASDQYSRLESFKSLKKLVTPSSFWVAEAKDGWGCLLQNVYYRIDPEIKRSRNKTSNLTTSIHEAWRFSKKEYCDNWIKEDKSLCMFVATEHMELDTDPRNSMEKICTKIEIEPVVCGEAEVAFLAYGDHDPSAFMSACDEYVVKTTGSWKEYAEDGRPSIKSVQKVWVRRAVPANTHYDEYVFRKGAEGVGNSILATYVELEEGAFTPKPWEDTDKRYSPLWESKKP